MFFKQQYKDMDSCLKQKSNKYIDGPRAWWTWETCYYAFRAEILKCNEDNQSGPEEPAGGEDEGEEEDENKFHILPVNNNEDKFYVLPVNNN